VPNPRPGELGDHFPIFTVGKEERRKEKGKKRRKEKGS